MRPRPETRYVAIDGLRGLAAVYVVVFHTNWLTHLAPTQFVGNGYLAVDLFFIISGFVIASAYGQRIGDGASFGRFMVARFFRIYPLHIAALAALVAIELARLGLLVAKGSVGGPTPFTGERSFELLLSHLLLLQGLGVTGSLGWNAPSWSISTEFVAYILFGATALAMLPFRRFLRPAVGLAMAAGLYAVLTIGWGTINAFPLLRCLAGFVLGVGLLGLVRETRVDAALAHLSPGTRNALELAVVAATLAVLATVSGAYAVAVMPLFAGAVLLAQAEGGVVSRLLKTRPVEFLGRTSYSVYMVHILCLFPFNIVLKRLAGGEAYMRLPDERPLMVVDPWAGDAAMAVAVVTVLVVSRYTYAWIEEPGRRFGRRLAARLQAAPVAAPEGMRA